MSKPTTIAQYMATLSPPARAALSAIRKVVLAAIPDGEETISYSMPAVRVDGRVAIYFAGWKEHVAVYPILHALPKFQKQLAGYETSKGALKLPLQGKLPTKLIADIAKHLAADARARGTTAKKKAGAPKRRGAR